MKVRPVRFRLMDLQRGKSHLCLSKRGVAVTLNPNTSHEGRRIVCPSERHAQVDRPPVTALLPVTIPAARFRHCGNSPCGVSCTKTQHENRVVHPRGT